jgi:hypothetical protein
VVIGEWMRQQGMIAHVELLHCFTAKKHLVYRFTVLETQEYEELLRFGREAPYRMNANYTAWAAVAACVPVPYFLTGAQWIAVFPAVFLAVLIVSIATWKPPDVIRPDGAVAAKSLLQLMGERFGSSGKVHQGLEITAAHTTTSVLAPVNSDLESQQQLLQRKARLARAAEDSQDALDSLDREKGSKLHSSSSTGCVRRGRVVWGKIAASYIVQHVRKLLNGDSVITQTVSKYLGVYDDVHAEDTVPWVGLLLLFGMALLAFILPISQAVMKQRHNYVEPILVRTTT